MFVQMCFFSPGVSLWNTVCITQHPHCMCPYVFLHIQAQLGVHEFGKVDILHRPEMRAPPPPCLFILLGGSFPFQQITAVAVISCILCVCCTAACQLLTHSSVSPLFYLQIPQCHHKKVRQHSISHLWIPMHFEMGGMCVCVDLCVCVRSQF